VLKMAISAFDEKAVIPTDDMVAAVLADAAPLWEELKNHVKETYPDVKEEWKHYGKAAGWTLKLLSKKSNLLFFIPKEECFRLRFGGGEKAMQHIEAADLPEVIKEAMHAATPYAEGRSFDLDISADEIKVMAYVKDRKLVDIGIIHGQQPQALQTLIRIKYDNK
jgi:hypothetical protein